MYIYIYYIRVWLFVLGKGYLLMQYNFFSFLFGKNSRQLVPRLRLGIRFMELQSSTQALILTSSAQTTKSDLTSVKTFRSVPSIRPICCCFYHNTSPRPSLHSGRFMSWKNTLKMARATSLCPTPIDSLVPVCNSILTMVRLSYRTITSHGIYFRVWSVTATPNGTTSSRQRDCPASGLLKWVFTKISPPATKTLNNHHQLEATKPKIPCQSTSHPFVLEIQWKHFKEVWERRCSAMTCFFLPLMPLLLDH